MAVTVKQVSTKQDWNTFIDLPWSIYSKESAWVPPLKMAVRDVLDVNKNPFFKHADMHAWVALDQSGKCVGRIVGVIDEVGNKYHDEKVVFFGFFESINDQKVANALLDTVVKWGKSNGMTAIRGPMNPSTNHECGLLIEGFDQTPSVMMTYNPQYYMDLLSQWGLTKAMDMFAYDIDKSKSRFAERLISQAEKVKARGDIVFRQVDMKRFDQEVQNILEIYNDAWEKNWGFVPMNEEEFRHMAKDMKLVLDPRLLLIAEVKGKPAGFALALPDVNQAMKKIPSGKLLPFGLFKLLWNLKGPGKRKTINRCRILTLGVKKEFLNLGLGPLFYTEYFNVGPANGYPVGEASWILENNAGMNRGVQLMDGKRTKAYRIYEKTLN